MARRDVGSTALVVAGVLGLLALVRPVATTTSTDAAGTVVTSSGWFGAVTSPDPVVAGSGPAFGWVVLVGLGLVAGALGLRVPGLRVLRRAGADRWSRGAAVLAGAWLLTTGVLVVRHTAARAQRVRDVLDPLVTAELEVTGSPGPWLLVAAGVLAAVGALTRPRPARSHPSEGPVVAWNP